MTRFVLELNTQFVAHSNDNVSEKQEAYLQQKFKLLGLTTPIRKSIQKPFLTKQNRPNKRELTKITTELWALPFREFQYAAIDLNRLYLCEIKEEDIQLFEHMITQKSWWDSVDLVSVHLVGTYFKLYPHHLFPTLDKWMASNNLWLQRACLLYQLKYKQNTSTEILEQVIVPLFNNKEFFLNKAIGWILREYSKTNPEWVIQFVETYQDELSNLSKKEALRLLI